MASDHQAEFHVLNKAIPSRHYPFERQLVQDEVAIQVLLRDILKKMEVCQVGVIKITVKGLIKFGKLPTKL